jgi:glutaredoxin
MILRVTFFVLASCIALSATAQQYRWTDKEGRTQYSDAPPPPWAKDVRKTNITTAKPQPAAAPLPYALQQLQKNFPVTLYSAPSCTDACNQVREALNRRGVPFEEVVVQDTETSDKLKSVAGAVEVPTLVVGRDVQRGFEQGAFDSQLDSAGYPRTGSLPPRAQKAPSENAAAPAKPIVEPVDHGPRPGPYDTSGLQGPPPKPGQYDPSGLTGPAPKPGQYGVPGEAAK